MKYIIFKCKECGKEIQIYWKDQRIKKKQKIFYCSKECASKSNLKGSIRKCEYCGREFYTTRNKYCSRNCNYLARRKVLPKEEVNTIGNSKNPKLYKKWWHMINRCNNSKDISFKNYGMRGIKVCEEWLDFRNFEKWSLQNNFNDNLELDRIDSNGNYEPSNCRFITRLENSRNRRITLKYQYKGKRTTLKEIADLEEIKYKTLWQKIHRDKLTLEQALRNTYRCI